MNTSIYLIILSVILVLFCCLNRNGSFVNPLEIYRQYFTLFFTNNLEEQREEKNKKKNTFLARPFILYNVIPILLGVAISLTKVLNVSITETLLVVLSLIATLLFSMYGFIITIQQQIKEKKGILEKTNIQRSQEDIYTPDCLAKEHLDNVLYVITQTFYILNYEILITIVLVVLCLIAVFLSGSGASEILKTVGSAVVYSLMFSMVFNLLILLKRLIRVVNEK